MYCWNCGHKNADGNKFCGECGKAQVRPPLAVEDEAGERNLHSRSTPAIESRRSPSEIRAEQSTKAQPLVVPPPGTGITPAPTPPLRATSTNPLVTEPRAIQENPLPDVRETPMPPPRTGVPPPRSSVPVSSGRISGPSFLGLSDAPTSSEYLFDEEETPEQSSTARSYIMLALVIVAGVLIYKQWDTVSGFAHDMMARAQAPASSTMEQASSVPPSPVASNAPAEQPIQKPEADGGSATEEKETAAPAPEKTEVDSAKEEKAPLEEEATQPEPTKTEAKAASEPARAPVYDDSPVEQAQKYLQGRGVAQDCNRGVSILRSAAAQPNPKAQIKLGALYATGHCVSQDRAEAYRWFAQAHELQPSNQWIDRNLNSLWAEMTTEERARAQR
jgi:hypothetical protein